jgi:serine/threonine protein phosphatase 1
VTATVPDGELVYAIGDVHGRSDLLTRLLAMVEQDSARHEAAKKILIFLGDYVDRGPDSRGVIGTLLHGLPEGFSTHFLKGNHEQLLLDFLQDPQRLDHWYLNGGKATLKSYGVDVGLYQNNGSTPEVWRDAFMEKLPPSHLAFLHRLSLQQVVGDYFFVHAGVRPGVPLCAQDVHDLLWIRRKFLESSEPFGKVVVHGHTPVSDPVVRPNQIGIDTGAAFTGRLTALRLIKDNLGFLQTPP